MSLLDYHEGGCSKILCPLFCGEPLGCQQHGAGQPSHLFVSIPWAVDSMLQHHAAVGSAAVVSWSTGAPTDVQACCSGSKSVCCLQELPGAAVLLLENLYEQLTKKR